MTDRKHPGKLPFAGGVRPSMRRSFYPAPFPFALLLLGLVGCTPVGANTPLRVLFIGNSFTYFHNTPAIFAALVAANQSEAPTVRLIASGGASLEDHLADSTVRRTLAKERWDAVVLQEQSKLGEVHLIRGRMRIAGGGPFRKAAGGLDSLARASGAKVWLVVPWIGADVPDEDQRSLRAIVGRVAKDLGVGAVEAGAAWQVALGRHLPNSLYDDDYTHPSPTGSFLYACTLYHAILGRAPTAFPRPIKGFPIRKTDGLQDPDSTVVLADILPADARALCDAAGTAQKLAGDPPVTAAALTRPTLPAGRAPSAAELAGQWHGHLLLYPSPAKLRIAFDSGGGGEFELSMLGGGEKKGRLDSVTVKEGVLRFVDRAGPNGTVIRYGARLVGDSLIGIAEFSNASGTLEGTGSWAAAKERR